MKINYYGYCLNRVSDNEHFLIDLRGLFQTFVSHNDIPYKHSFTRNGENLYLIPATGSFYYFIMTKNNEAIKTIEAGNLNVGELRALLQADESVGFSSYVLIRSSSIAFASTVLAPKMRAFCDFTNDIFISLGLQRYQFVISPLLYEITEAEALTLPFIGRSKVEITHGNGLFSQLQTAFNCDADDFQDIDALEITIKPRRKRNIAAAVRGMINASSGNGLAKLQLKGKDELHDHLSEFYLAGLGQISDQIDGSDERQLLELFQSKITGNTLLANKVTEHEQNPSFGHVADDDFSMFDDASTWPAYVSPLQGSS